MRLPQKHDGGEGKSAQEKRADDIQRRRRNHHRRQEQKREGIFRCRR